MRSIETVLANKIIFWSIFAVLAAFHLFASISNMSDKFDNEPAAGPFGGIRLHYLKVLNFDFSTGVSSQGGTSHILDNFMKSAVSGTHGLLDFLHWYVYSGIYDMLGIPINEFWLLLAQTAVMFSALVIMALLIKRLYDSYIAAISFIIISSQLYLQHSISFYIIPVNTLFEGLLLFAIYRYNRKESGYLSGLWLFMMLFVNSACGNAIKLPIYFFFIWAVIYKRNGCGPLRSFKEYIAGKPSNLIFTVPVAAALVMHLYVYKRIGESNLGMLGWISQKIGFGAPVISKFASFGNSLNGLIFGGAWDWWAFFIIAVFYAIALLRGGRKMPLLLFPLLYYFYLINLEPYSAMLPYLIISTIAISEVFNLAEGVKERRAGRLCGVFAVLFASYMLLTPVIAVARSSAAGRRPVPNYLKSIGYYLREHMSREDKIASLLSDTQNILNEYYYGKNFFKSPVFGKYIYDLRNLTTPFSPSNPVTSEEADTEFAFYVVSAGSYANDNDYAGFVNKAIKKYSLKKVADVTEGRVVFASIYSSMPLPYEKVETKEANRAFDKKYANLKKLFYNHHVGVASTWGFY